MNPALRRSAAHVFVESIDVPQLDDQDHHHLTRVLRLRAGEAVSVSDGRGAWRLCRFLDGAALGAETEIVVEPARTRPVTIGFALAKGDRPEWIVQKLTEIGVDHMIVIESERSVTRWSGDKAERNLAKLRKVAREAAMQSRRVRLPRVDGPVALGALGELVTTPVVLADPGGRPLGDDDRCLLIGPEGGWSAGEMARIADRAALGDPILRVETAALVAATRLVTIAERDSG